MVTRYRFRRDSLIGGDAVRRAARGYRPIADDTVSFPYDPHPATGMPTAEWEKEFERLYEQWKLETELSSSMTEIVMNESYQRLIGMGEQVLPTILARLDAEFDDPDYWFWALRMITGENPAAAADSPMDAALAWLKWGRARGHII